MRAYNFASSGHNLTKFCQGMWLIAGVIKWTRGAIYKILEGKKRRKFSAVFNNFQV